MQNNFLDERVNGGLIDAVEKIDALGEVGSFRKTVSRRPRLSASANTRR
jgi:hypothetical protein